MKTIARVALSLSVAAATTCTPAWKTAVSTDGSFAADFRGVPDESRGIDASGEAWCWLRSTIGVSVIEKRVPPVVLMAGYIETPGQGTRGAFERGMADLVAMAPGGKVAERTTTSVQGYPAEDLVLEERGMHVRARMVATPGRLYRLIVLDTGAVSSAGDAERFLASLRISPTQRK